MNTPGYIVICSTTNKPVDVFAGDQNSTDFFEAVNTLCEEWENKGKHVAELIFDDFPCGTYNVNHRFSWCQRTLSLDTYEPRHRIEDNLSDVDRYLVAHPQHDRDYAVGVSHFAAVRGLNFDVALGDWA